MDTDNDALATRAKVGVVVPATNTIAQPEYEAMRPWGVTNHVTRMAPAKRGSTEEEYRRSLARGHDHVKAALDLVVPCKPNIILLGHSIDTFRGGVAGADAMARELTDHAGGIEVVLPAHAFLAALERMSPRRRIAVLTPYFPPGDEQVQAFFADAGYEIARLIGLACPTPLAIAATPAAKVVEALRTLAEEDVDLIIQPGTNLATARLADRAADWIGKPVLSCNTVNYWHVLRRLGIEDRIPGFGELPLRH